MRNRYPGQCYRCGMEVLSGGGHFEKHPTASGKWRVQHADCAIRWRGQPSPSMAEAREAHEHPKYMRREQRQASGS
jgi:hypothetical protein